MARAGIQSGERTASATNPTTNNAASNDSVAANKAANPPASTDPQASVTTTPKTIGTSNTGKSRMATKDAATPRRILREVFISGKHGAFRKVAAIATLTCSVGRVPIDRQGEIAMNKTELLQGTLDLLILRVLNRGQMHGWGIAERIGDLSKDVLTVGEGSLYPALYRMQERGWIESEWGQSDNNRKAKFYQLTKLGRKQLEVEQESWDRLALAISSVLKLA